MGHFNLRSQKEIEFCILRLLLELRRIALDAANRSGTVA